ncbi:MAG: hypothetical protein ACE5K0_01455 [Candidatus Methanofastidiosia archaeon]
MSGNYIAASNHALKAIGILKEIIGCCEVEILNFSNQKLFKGF